MNSHVFFRTSPSTRPPQASSAPAARHALHRPRGHHDGFAGSPFALEVALAIDELRLLLYPLSFLEVALAIDKLRLLLTSLSFLEVALAIDELRLLLTSLSFLEVALAIDELRLLFGSLLVSWNPHSPCAVDPSASGHHV